MKKTVSIFFVCCCFFYVSAQRENTDSLRQVLRYPASDTAAVLALVRLSAFYSFVDPDTALVLADTAIQKAAAIKYPFGEVLALCQKAEAVDRIGEYGVGLNIAYGALRIAQKLSSQKDLALAQVLSLIAHFNALNNNDSIAIAMLRDARTHYRNSGRMPEQMHYTYYRSAFSFLKLGKADSAFYYAAKGAEMPDLIDRIKNPTPLLIHGNVYLYGADSVKKAQYFFLKGLDKGKELETPFLISILYFAYARSLLGEKKIDSSIFYLRKSLGLSQKNRYKLFEMDATGLLSYIYEESGKTDSALKYMKMYTEVNNEVFGAAKIRHFQSMGFEEEKRQREIAQAEAAYKQRIGQYVLAGGLAAFLLIAAILWFSNRRKKKLNATLTEQKEKTEKTLAELKATQVQLIQSAKMASLGELTAGIAHEIQNPLNFVNNFSDVNKELTIELESELDKEKIAEARILAADIRENEEKINHHGKRADAIVKNMLQHSRTATGIKEPTDINALVDEYLRLAYHGMKAKDKSFNATLVTDFDEKIGKISIIPQDIGRVLLNLYNNSFYALSAKSRDFTSSKPAGDFIPEIKVTTRKTDNRVEVTVTDNGSGIAANIVDKIFQPFFTTKPTGQGTGLGLSLSYDITKAHGGEIKINNKPGEGVEFIISLPG